MDKIEAKDRLIIALDLLDVDEARRMVDRLGDTVTFYKVGLSLQLASGVEGLVHDLISRGKKVFLDYKYYDVQETLRKAVSQAARPGVSFLTVHGTGDGEAELSAGACQPSTSPPAKAWSLISAPSLLRGVWQAPQCPSPSTR